MYLNISFMEPPSEDFQEYTTLTSAGVDLTSHHDEDICVESFYQMSGAGSTVLEAWLQVEDGWMDTGMVTVVDEGGRDMAWNILQIEANTNSYDNMYLVYQVTVNRTGDIGYVAIDDVTIRNGKCRSLSCGFQVSRS